MSVTELEQLLNCKVDKWHTLKEINLCNKGLNTLPSEVYNLFFKFLLSLDFL